jgi:hypothetical protein
MNAIVGSTGEPHVPSADPTALGGGRIGRRRIIAVRKPQDMSDFMGQCPLRCNAGDDRARPASWVLCAAVEWLIGRANEVDHDIVRTNVVATGVELSLLGCDGIEMAIAHIEVNQSCKRRTGEVFTAPNPHRDVGGVVDGAHPNEHGAHRNIRAIRKFRCRFTLSVCRQGPLRIKFRSDNGNCMPAA